MEEATQQGAILERLENYLGASEEPREETQEAEAVEESVEESDNSGEAEQSTENDEEQEVDESKEDATEEAGETLELSDLAEYLKIEADKLDVDDDGNLFVKTKVDGEEGKATLSDLIKSYQLEGHLNKQNMEVQSLKKELETKQAELEKQSQERLTQLESLSQLAWNELNSEYQSVDWQSLRVEDPAEFAAKLAEYQQREARLNQAFQQINAEKQSAIQSNQGRTQEILAEESKKLMSAIPEWQDSSVAEKERADVRKYALGVGFNDNEIGNVIDHRMVLVLRDAMKYRALQESKPAIQNKVKKAPKVVKPGSVKKPSQDKKTSDMRKVIKKTGGKEGVVDYLLATGRA